ncbi:hypothetical protein F070042J6_30990 [Bacteroides sp. f07]
MKESSYTKIFLTIEDMDKSMIAPSDLTVLFAAKHYEKKALVSVAGTRAIKASIALICAGL